MIDAVLPAGWAWATLRELGVWTGGGTPSKSQPAYWANGQVPWLSPKDMTGPALSGTRDTIHELALAETTLKLVKGPSVVIVVRSGILERTVPIALVPFDTTLNQDMKAVTPTEGISAPWLAFVLRSMEHKILRECRKAGTTVASLEYDRLLDLRLPVPPSDEQKRVVDALNELQGAIRGAAAEVESVQRRTSGLRDAMLRSFLPQEGETALTVGRIADLGSGATPAKGDSSYYVGGSVPWLTSGDLNTRVISSARQFVTEKALKETAVKVWPAGTLLVAMYGEGKTRGRAARLAFASTTNQACAAIRLRRDAPVSVEFLQAFFDATYRRNRRLGGGGVQPNLSLGVIRGIRVPVRAPKEQARLVANYEGFLEEQGKLLAQLAGVRFKLSALEMRLLLYARSGGLVPQSPADESAELLLKRLRTEREERASAGAAKRRTVRSSNAPRSGAPKETAA